MYSIAKLALQISNLIVGMVGSVLPLDKSTRCERADIAPQIASHWRAVGGYIQSAMEQERHHEDGKLQQQP